MVRHDVDSILAQRTQSVSDESDESDQHSVANNSEASSQSEGNDSVDYICEMVAREIHQLTGKKIGGLL
ncbi:unnamed protein product [Rhizophagus irregularis]|nr:unnamed protein product [Rhizophagus irregularis]